eukprot:TRINITY_DN1631_c0_g1_i2.p1 TRINITY_DN1631_c0_g1~~TRINITY_DN1631_c0_g1_i2.p1  ORF type:complete len:2354 (-),score=397.74 TRINITY_DN1631_c0_g1_i2:13-7074(-)
MAPVTATLLQSVHKIEKALDSALRTGDAHLIQNGCILIWNLSLPLLQPTTRKQIRQPFVAALTALDRIASNLHRLKVQFQLEIAKCDVADDFFAKARSQIKDALAVDYVADVAEKATFGMERPLDRFLIPTQYKLELVSNIYVLPQCIEDEATLLIEQATDASNVGLRVSLLERAIAVLMPGENLTVQAPEVTAAPQEIPAQTKKGHSKSVSQIPPEPVQQANQTPSADQIWLRKRAELWAAIVNVGWKEKSARVIEPVRTAASRLLANKWTQKADRPMQIEQAKACFTVAETYVVALKGQGVAVCQRFFSELASDDAHVRREAERKMQQVVAAEEQIQQYLMRGVQLGLDLIQQGWEDQWVLWNGCANFWNWHLTAFRRGDYLAALPVAEFCYRSLVPLVSDERDTQHLCNISAAYIRSLVQRYIRTRTASDAECLEANASTFPTAPDGATSEYLQQAASACEKMIGLLRPMDAKHFHLMLHNVRRLQGRSAEVRGAPQERVLTFLELLQHPGADHVRYVNEAFLALSENPNVELCARLAVAGLAHQPRTTVLVCAIGKELAAQGRLGAKENAPVPQKHFQEQLQAQQQQRAKAGAGAGGKRGSSPAPPPAPPQAATPKPGDKKKTRAEDDGAATENTTIANVSDPRAAPPPGATELLWYGTLLLQSAQATVACIERNQPRTTQNEMRRLALLDAIAAAVQANRAFSGGSNATTAAALLQECIATFYAAALPFCRDAAGRTILFEPLKELLAQLGQRAKPSAAGGGSGPADDTAVKLLYLCLALFECLKDRHEYQQGLDRLKEALALLPRQLHRSLWELDIEFRCRLGLNPSQTLLRVKEYDRPTQARAWYRLARCSAQAKDQLAAYQRCVEAVSDTPDLQAEYLIMFAFWMLCRGFSLRDVLDHVGTAADVLGDAVTPEPEEPEVAAGGAMSVHSARKSVSGFSVAMESTVSSRNGRKASVRGGPKSTATLTVANAAGTGGSLQSGSTAPARAPTQRVTVQQLELLARSHITLATLALPSDDEHRGNLLLAHYYYVTALRLAADTANTVNRKGKGQALSVSTASVDGSSPLPQQPELPLPTEHQGWIGFAFSTTAIAALQTAAVTEPIYSISPVSVPHPKMALYFLRQAVSMLLDAAMELHALPLLLLEFLVSRLCFPATDTVARGIGILAQLELTHVHQLLNAPPPAAAVPQSVGISEADRTEFLELIKQLQETGSADSTVEASDAEQPYVQLVGLERALSMRAVWIAQAELLAADGQAATARALLTEADLHARAWRDPLARARCLHGLAALARLEGKRERAHLLNEQSLGLGSGLGGGTQAVMQTTDLRQGIETFLRAALLRSRLLIEEDNLEAAVEWQRSLAATVVVQKQRFEEMCKAPDTTQFVVQLLLRQFAVFQRSFVALALQSPRPLTDHWVGVLQKLLTQAKDVLRGDSLQYARVLLVEHDIIRYQRPVTAPDNTTEDLQVSLRLLTEARVLLEALLRDALPDAGALRTAALSSTCLSLHRMLTDVAWRTAENQLEQVRRYAAQRLQCTLDKMPLPSVPTIEGKLFPQEAFEDFFRLSERQKQRKERARREQESQRELEARRAARAEQRTALQKQVEALEELNKTKKKGQNAKPGAKGKSDSIPGAQSLGQLDPVAALQALDNESDEDSKAEQARLARNGADDGSSDEEEEAQQEAERRRLLLPAADTAAPPPLLTAATAAVSAAVALVPSAAPRCRLLAGQCFRLEWELKATAEEQRVFERAHGALPPPKPLLDRLWNPPGATGPFVAVAEESTGKGANKSQKTADAAAAAAQRKSKSVPSGSVDFAAEAEDAHHFKDPTGNAGGIPLVAQAAGQLHRAVLAACDTDDFALGAEAALELAHCHATGNQTIAARWLAIAQAFQHSYETQKDFHALGSSNLEASLLRLLESLDTVTSSARQALRQRLAQQSRIYSAITVTQEHANPNGPLSLQKGNVALLLYAPLNTDVLYAALLQGGTEWTHVSRAALDQDKLTALTCLVEQWNQDREAFCTGGGGHKQNENFWDSLDERLQGQIVPSMMELLAPVVQPLNASLAAAAASGAHLVLIPSMHLHVLPLEAHPAFMTFKSMSRDFSLLQALRRTHLPAGGEKFTVASHLAYIVDPFNETAGALQAAMTPKGAHAPRGRGISGVDHIPSTGEWQRILTDAQSQLFVFHGLGRLATNVPLLDIAGLDLGGIHAAIVLDRAINNNAARRQSKQDLLVAERHKPLARPERVANLLCCRGAGGLVVNMYTTSINANNRVLAFLLSQVEKLVPLAEAVAHLRQDQRAQSRDREQAAPAGGKPRDARTPKHPTEADSDAAGAAAKLPFLDRITPVVYGAPSY